jgi:hypothetical protein
MMIWLWYIPDRLFRASALFQCSCFDQIYDSSVLSASAPLPYWDFDGGRLTFATACVWWCLVILTRQQSTWCFISSSNGHLLIYLELSSVGRLVAVHPGESRVVCTATNLPTELSPRYCSITTGSSHHVRVTRHHKSSLGSVFKPDQWASLGFTKFILVNHCTMAHNHPHCTPEDLCEDAWGSTNIAIAIWAHSGLATVEFLVWNKLIWNSVVWNSPWASPKWPFTTVEYMSYWISAVWNWVGQHFGWSPNFIPYEGFNCIGRNHRLSIFFAHLSIPCRVLDIQARDDHRAIWNVVLSVLDQYIFIPLPPSMNNAGYLGPAWEEH